MVFISRHPERLVPGCAYDGADLSAEHVKSENGMKIGVMAAGADVGCQR